jgi:hypothetical protein
MNRKPIVSFKKMLSYTSLILFALIHKSDEVEPILYELKSKSMIFEVSIES